MEFLNSNMLMQNFLVHNFVMMMMKMMNCFCGMVDRRKAFSLISSRDHCQRSSPSRICDTPWAEFDLAQKLSLGLVEWSCAVVITTTVYLIQFVSIFNSMFRNKYLCKIIVAMHSILDVWQSSEYTSSADINYIRGNTYESRYSRMDQVNFAEDSL